MSSDTESETSDGDYTTSSLWSDIHPIPQDDGPTPLAQIAYHPEYAIAMSYLRAVMAKNEVSERVLGLTGDVIRMNPAHYTVWSFRFKCLVGLSRLQEEEKKRRKDGGREGNKLTTTTKTMAASEVTRDEGSNSEHKEEILQKQEEIAKGEHPNEEEEEETSSSTKNKFERNYWLEELAYTTQIASIYEKNYQIWHHRQLIVDYLSLASRTNPNGISLYNERAVTQSMFDKDSKNYHVWTYRQWLVGRFGLFDDNVEETFTKEMIEKDVRNNSAWNHRFFVMFGGVGGDAGNIAESREERVERELRWAGDMVERAPQNASVWNYLKGVLTHANKPLSTIKSLCESYAPIDSPDFITSSHALDFLAQIYADEGDVDNAIKALNLLSTTFDPIRKNYWSYRQRIVEMNSGKTGHVHSDHASREDGISDEMGGGGERSCSNAVAAGA